MATKALLRLSIRQWRAGSAVPMIGLLIVGRLSSCPLRALWVRIRYNMRTLQRPSGFCLALLVWLLLLILS